MRPDLSMKKIRNSTMTHCGNMVYQSTYLRGVLGLPMIRRGERIFGSNENFSLMFSRTDGATYVKPYREIRDKTQVQLVEREVVGECKEEMIYYRVRRRGRESAVVAMLWVLVIDAVSITRCVC